MVTCHDSQSVLLFETTNNSNNRTIAMKTMNAFKYDVSPDGNITVWRLSWYSLGGLDPLSKKTVTGRMVTLFIKNRTAKGMMISTCHLDSNMLIASENHVTAEVARQCWSDLTTSHATHMKADQISYADMLRLSLSYSLLPRKI